MTKPSLAVLVSLSLCSTAFAQQLDPLPPLPGATEKPKPAEPKTEEAKTEEPKPEEAKPEEAKTEEAKPEEAKTEEAKTAEPEEPTTEAMTEEAKAEEPKAEEAKTEPAEVEAAEEILAEGGLEVRGAAGEGSVPLEVRDNLDAAVAALVAADPATARELLNRVRAALPATHWLLPTVVKLEKLSFVLDRGAVEDESVASLYITLTMYGFYTGVWLFGILGEIDLQATIPLSVATAGIGLGAAYVLDHREEPLNGATADAISSGLFLGAAEALILLAAVNPDDFSEKGWTSVVWGSSLVGAIIGGVAVRATGASRGDVSLSTAGYTWGAVLGVTTSMMLNVDDFDNAAKVVLVGTAAGFGLGLGLAHHYEMSATRVLYINLGGLAGALVGTGVVVGGSFDSIEAVGATLSLTYVGGLALGWYLTRNIDLPEGAPVALQTAPTLIPSPDPTRAPTPGLAMTLTW